MLFRSPASSFPPSSSSFLRTSSLSLSHCLRVGFSGAGWQGRTAKSLSGEGLISSTEELAQAKQSGNRRCRFPLPALAIESRLQQRLNNVTTCSGVCDFTDDFGTMLRENSSAIRYRWRCSRSLESPSAQVIPSAERFHGFPRDAQSGGYSPVTDACMAQRFNGALLVRCHPDHLSGDITSAPP